MRNRRVFKAVIALFILATLAVVTAYANSMRDMKSAGQTFNATPEAISACKDKSDDNIVTIVFPNGETLSATCTVVYGKLVAIPDKRSQAK